MACGKMIACCGLDCEKCAAEKGFDHCGLCPEMEKCQTVQMIHGSNAQAKENLKK